MMTVKRDKRKTDLGRSFVSRLGARVKMIRESGGFSQEEAAARAGFSRWLWVQIEGGKPKWGVKAGFLAIIADALGCDVIELID